PRRCGWFDAVILRKAAMLNGLDSMAITKLDVLDSLEQIKICTAYKLDGNVTDEFPDSIAELERVEPIYEIVDGWKTDTTKIKDMDKLPAKAKDYLKRLSHLVDCSISMVSVGPDRHQTMLTKKF
ncbi:MAG: adenylosuccinate synthetase, partial [Fibrobacterota bacterium]